jgi:hypothetical protein
VIFFRSYQGVSGAPRLLRCGMRAAMAARGYGGSGSTRRAAQSPLAAAQHGRAGRALPILHTCHPLRVVTRPPCRAYSSRIPFLLERFNLPRRQNGWST